MPPAATVQATIAPNTPVASPNRRGNMKMPDPIIDPTTMAANAGNDIFWVGDVGEPGAAGVGSTGRVSADSDMAPPHQGAERVVIPVLSTRAAPTRGKIAVIRRGAPPSWAVT